MNTHEIPIRILERFSPCNVPEDIWARNILFSIANGEYRHAGCCLWAKRLLDICGSLGGLFILSPFLFIIGILVKLDSPGPVLYKQKRMGLHGEIFTIYKFRTMYQDAENDTGPEWAPFMNHKITRIGKFLRRYHLDEIPQLWNVLKGEMSLVGPRPERPEFVYSLHNLIPNYERRLTVKPGITGWAQIRQHYDTGLEDVKRKLRYDLFYIKKMCLGVDVKLIVQTIFAILLGKAVGI